MSGAFLWGVLASSSLLIGALVALRRPIAWRTLGMVMAFGAGVLISAVAYELVAESIRLGDRFAWTAMGLGAGAITYYVGDVLIERMGSNEETTGSELILGIVLDGIPESVVIGLTLIAGGSVSVAMLAAVFLSNLPEAIAATTSLRHGGRSVRWILGLWVTIMLVSGVAAWAGYALFLDASGGLLAFVLAFAGGAVLTMLADTMMPVAYKHGGPRVGLFTTLGFAVSVAIVAAEHA